MTRTVIHGDVVLPDRVVWDGAILIEGGRVVEVDARQRLGAAGANVIARRGFVLPGFVDMHVHGGRGADFMDGDVESFDRVVRAHARRGTTSIAPTTCVASRERILQVLEVARDRMRPGRSLARVLGVHFYGPYFGAEAVGCHPRESLRPPTPAEYREYLAYSDAMVSATVAPELEGAEAFARACRERGVVVNLGHSHCTFEQARAAIDWGATHVDHLFCAMSDRARLRREVPFPMRGGLLEATLYSDELTTEVIADGKHLGASLLLLAAKIKGPDRLALVTDASRAMDMPDGEYFFGPRDAGVPFRRENGVGVTLDGGNLASSVVGMDDMVRTMAALTRLPLPEVVRMASLTPARILGKDAEIGSLEMGKWADMVLTDRELKVEQVWIGGEPIARGEVLDWPTGG